MRILLTGGTGFVGQYVCRELLSRGCDVLILTRTSTAAFPHSRNGIGASRMVDLQHGTELRNIVAEFRPDVMLHLAALIPKVPETRAGWEVFAVNAQGTANLLEACADLDTPPSLVYVSSMSVYDYDDPQYLPVDERHPISPVSAYGLSKYMGEMLCRHYARTCSVPCIMLRLPGVFGPGKRSGLIYNLLHSAVTLEPISLVPLTVRRDFIYVRDVARAVALSIEVVRDGRSVLCNLSGGPAPPLSGLVQVVETVAGHKIVVKIMENHPARDFYFNPSTAKNELGFVASSIQDAIADFWSQFDKERVE